MSKKQKRVWHFLDNLTGDKVVWIVCLLLMLLSTLLIFSSSYNLAKRDLTRLDLFLDQVKTVGMGLLVVIIIYNFPKLEWIRVCSAFGFFFSLFLLIILDAGGIGPIEAPRVNGAVRYLEYHNTQIHIFEMIKVAMIMYTCWAVDRLENGGFGFLNKYLKTRMARKAVFLYAPAFIVILMVMKGSNSAALLIGLLILACIFIGTGDFKDMLLMGALMGTLFLAGFGIYSISKARGDEHPKMERIGTLVGRLSPRNYEAEYFQASGSNAKAKVLDDMRQPYSAKIAIHQGGLFGKGPGQSTQRYVVPDMPEDYMFSFVVEEYGLLGALVVLILYASLVARGVLIVKTCGENTFAQSAIAGLVLLISGQAFLHILTNCELGPLTGQTLPLLSHGKSAFLCFSLAFGIILAISKIAKKDLEQMAAKEESLTAEAEGRTQDHVYGL